MSVTSEFKCLIHIQEGGTPVPSIGTRDTSQLRTLLSIIFKMGYLAITIQIAWPSRGDSHAQPQFKILDVDDAP